MNAENFATYLKNPTQLYQISYQELKSLVLEYPYCQNLRYLLLLKSQIDQNNDFDHNLQKAATYSFDRSYLFKQFKSAPSPLSPVEKETYQVEDEVLELEQIEMVPNDLVEQEMLQALKAKYVDEKEEVPLVLGESNSDEEFELDLEDLQLAATPEETAIEEVPEPKFEFPEALAAHMASIQLITKDWMAQSKPMIVEEEVTIVEMKSTPKPTPSPIPSITLKGSKPLPKKVFGAKKPKKSTSKIKLSDIGEDKKKKKKKTNKVVEFAERSVKDNAGNASETLAYLLTEQGFYDKAIEIYQRLILLFPKNSEKYLKRIEELKSKI